MPFESGRRLCLLFTAGRVRYAIEATSVVEVAPPDADGDSIRGFLELEDLSQLLGGPAEQRPGMAVVLDVSPTLALRVRTVEGVHDLARAPVFRLPQGLAESLALVARGGVLHDGRLFLELVAEALPHRVVPLAPIPPRPVYLLEEVPDRALVFESQGRIWGIPLPLVSQVVAASDAFCPLPLSGGPVAGLFPHVEGLWPIYSAPGLLGGEGAREELFILAELAGQQAGLTASRVLGVHQDFELSGTPGELIAARLGVPALFLDLQRMFS
ncbi:MAG: chemotaxis protein CheW [Myxococcota bacterium]